MIKIDQVSEPCVESCYGKYDDNGDFHPFVCPDGTEFRDGDNKCHQKRSDRRRAGVVAPAVPVSHAGEEMQSQATIQVPRELAETLVELYNGMLEAGSNGIGYSPRVHQAMKKLHDQHPADLKLSPVAP